MPPLFEELDYRPTSIGALSLRRRRDLRLERDVYEIKLGEEFLMSSLFTASEIALAQLSLALLSGRELDVVVGGLGLGYTAKAVLDAVIEWHQTGLVPLGHGIVSDERCTLLHGDFFALAASEAGFAPEATGRRYDAVLVDIDHSPEALLYPGNSTFYGETGLRRLACHLKPGGIFGLWSNDAPDEAFVSRLVSVFATAWSEPVTFHNPLQDRPFTQTVYLARTAG